MSYSKGNQGAEIDSEVNVKQLAWVKASDRRVDILTSLAGAPKNTSDFAEDWEVETESVRYHLRQLQEGGPNGDLPGLIKCLTPGMNQYKLYGLTEEGSDLVEYL